MAVLPFASESADAEMELLNRIIVERVIDTVSRTPGVRVLAYNTVQHHRGKDLDFRRLGENLLVDAIAAGEMIRHNDELLLHVELIDGMEVSSGVSSSKNIIPMFSKNPRHWLIRFVIGCGQFWFALRTAEETNDLDTRSVIRLVVRSESTTAQTTKSLLPVSLV